MEIEPEMLAMETIVPVYFAVEDEALLSIYEQTQAASTSQGSASAAEGALEPCPGPAVSQDSAVYGSTADFQQTKAREPLIWREVFPVFSHWLFMENTVFSVPSTCSMLGRSGGGGGGGGWGQQHSWGEEKTRFLPPHGLRTLW